MICLSWDSGRAYIQQTNIADEAGRNHTMGLGVTTKGTTNMKFFIEHWSRPQICIPFGKIICLFTMLVVGIMALSLPASAWEVKTHRELTGQAINIKAGVLGTYLKENLGLESGLNEMVDDKTVREWILEGSDLEDGELPFSRRPLNHFHDALNNRGLEAALSGMSAVDWSLEGIGAQDGEDSFSWNDAREFYFKALTAPTKTERDENWGKTFRALGQVMHLLQDSANPSHVRNDDHLDLSASFGPLGRIDVDGLHDYMARQNVGSYPGATFFTPDSSLLETEGAIRSEPFSNLFDTNTYNGGNPGATLGTDVGITEFTNANFFSDDTIPGQSTLVLFPFPDITELVPGPSNLPYLTLPRLGSPTFPAARAAKLTGNQAAAQFLLTNTSLDLIGKLQLDDMVYDAQAQNLIPRAIDYSAAVPEYFFRLPYTLEPSSHAFGIMGQVGAGGECEHNPSPGVTTGGLGVEMTIPSDLNFTGTASLYYHLPNNDTRILGAQIPDVPSGESILLTVNIPHAGLPIDEKFRWYVVLDGQAGPGTQEQPRAILANTDEAEWEWFCLF